MRLSKRPESGLSRREFLVITSIAATNLALGCATNPVTGRSQFMLMDESEEIAIDHQQSPHQFSADYGTVQDQALQAYIQTTGKAMAAKAHRPHMPYDFHCVNANYVNAYAFPGGSIACTRGILLDLENEAELGALLGHELGHVNARHTAASLSKAKVASAAAGGLAIVTSVAVGSSVGSLAGQLGQLGAGALLASYSRDNERQADHLGMEYMTRTGYGPQGMVGLMDMLNSMNQHKASSTELLFATHPMSSERYQTAVAEAKNNYGKFDNLPLHRERYMDHTASLRKIKGCGQGHAGWRGGHGQGKICRCRGLVSQIPEGSSQRLRRLAADVQVPADSGKRQRGREIRRQGQGGLPSGSPSLSYQRDCQNPQWAVMSRPMTIFPLTKNGCRVILIRFFTRGFPWKGCKTRRVRPRLMSAI